MWDTQGGLCYYTGVQMTRIVGDGRLATNASIDRVSPNLGYDKSNVVLCCYHINMAKRDGSIDDYIKWATLAQNHLYNKQLT